MTERDTRRDRASALNLHGLLAHWGEIASETWVTSLLGWEEQERARRSLERRLRTAHIGRFKPLCDFDWAWPKRCDRAAVDTLMTLEFLNDAANVVLVGPNGVGKSMIILQRATEGRAQGVILLGPVPAIELTGAFAAKQNDGLPRRRTGTDFVFGVHRSPRHSASELRSGRVSYLAVHLGPQQSPGPVNPAFQSSYGAAGRLSGLFITLLLDPDQMKGFFLFLRQSLIGDVELANTGAVLL
jgi:hypothetical protein